MGHRLGIELLSVFGLPPVPFVELAARLGCQCISIGPTGTGYNPHGYPDFSLLDDAQLRRDLAGALRDHGVSIALGEGCIIRAQSKIRDAAATMDMFAELGAERVNTVILDGELGRGLEQLAIFAQMAAERGMASSIELCPVLPIATLDQAVAAVRSIDAPGFGLLLDAMHLGRAGVTGADLAALDPDMIGYFQLCDAPAVADEANYMMEATFERRRPGDGDMPLLEYLSVLPDRVPVSLEIPLKSEAELGKGPIERLRPAVAMADTLFEQVKRSRTASVQ